MWQTLKDRFVSVIEIDAPLTVFFSVVLVGSVLLTAGPFVVVAYAPWSFATAIGLLLMAALIRTIKYFITGK